MKLPKIATKKQRLLFEYGFKHAYSLLCADPRLGKSAVAVWLQQARQVNTLIICPSYLILNWRREIKKWSPNAQVTMFRKGSDIYEVVDADFVVISFDLAQKAEHLFSWCDMVVIDEIHNLKSMEAKRTQFIHQAVFENSVKYFHGLTGTPLKNRVREFYSIMALAYYDPNGKQVVPAASFAKFLTKNLHKISPFTFLDVYPDEILFAEKFSYRQAFNVKVKGKKGQTFMKEVVKYEGLRNVDELRLWLQEKYIRIRADNKDLPPVSYKDILVSDSPNKALLAAFDAFFDAKDSHLVRPDVKVQAALQLVPFTIKYVDNLVETVGCCLVYSDHVEPIKAIAKHFKVPAITAAMPPHKRAQLVADFQAGKIDMICSTIGCLKEGADLFRSKDIIINDPCWVPGDLKQVINRIRALGEKAPRTVHRMLGSPQSEKIYEKLYEKMLVIEAAT